MPVFAVLYHYSLPIFCTHILFPNLSPYLILICIYSYLWYKVKFQKTAYGESTCFIH